MSTQTAKTPWYTTVLAWLALVWASIMGFFAHVWMAAKTAALGTWNSEAMTIKFAAAFLASLGFVGYTAFTAGLTIWGAFVMVGVVTSGLTLGLAGIHMVASFITQLFIGGYAKQQQSPFPFEHEKKAEWARQNTRAVA